MTMTGSLPNCIILGNIFFLDKRKYSQNANGRRCGCGYGFVAVAMGVCVCVSVKYLKDATSGGGTYFGSQFQGYSLWQPRNRTGSSKARNQQQLPKTFAFRDSLATVTQTGLKLVVILSLFESQFVYRLHHQAR